MALAVSLTQEATINLRTLCDALGGIAHKWFKIGIQLGIPHNKLLEFQGSPDPLSAVIDYWLRGNATESVDPISWNSIVAMLKSKYVGEPGLADEINKIYCQQEENKSDSSSPVKGNYQRQVEKAESSHPSSPPSIEDKMDPDMRLDLEFILEKNLKEIVTRYASYVDCLRIAIKEKGVSPEDLQSYLLSLSATSKSYKGQKLSLLYEKRNQLKVCNTITDIFNFLTTECASFLNYDIFQFILKRYGVCDENEEFKYPDHLKAYIRKHKISEFTKINPLLKSKAGSKELTLKYDISITCSLAKLEELKKVIAEIMDITPSALELIDIKEGCVIVTFLIPALVADVLFTPYTVFTPQQEEDLRAASVLWLKCNGLTFHFEKQKLKAFQKLKEQLTCSICLGTYTDPKQLQCQHAYCQQCLMGLVQQDQQGQPTLTCPTCRQVTPVPASGVAGLQADFRTNQLLEIVGKDWKESVLAQTSPVSLELSTKESLLHDSIFSCPVHDEVLMELYCGACEVAICWKCSLKDCEHHGHGCKLLDEVFAQCIRDILSFSKAIAQALAQLDARCEEISNQQAAIEEEIQSCIIAIDDRKSELTSELHQLTQAKLKGLAAQRDQLETTQAQLDKHLHFMKDTSNHKEVMQKKSTTVKQTKELITTFQPDQLIPNTKANMILADRISDGHIYNEVCTETLPDFSKCCVSGKGLKTATVGSKSTIILLTFDQNHQPCKVSTTAVQCELVSETTGTSEKVNVESKRLSQYEISYQPTITGTNQLHIKVKGRHIKGSPFPVRLRSFGTQGSGQGQFKSPYGIALDGEDNILVTDRNNHRIQKFTSQREFLTSVGAKGSGPLKFVHPRGIAVNTSNGRVYVTDKSDNIQVLKSDLDYFGMLASKAKPFRPGHIACSSIGNVYVTDYSSHHIQVFTSEGEFLWTFGGHEEEPYGIALDSRDKVYVSDWKHYTFSTYTWHGQFETSFGREESEQDLFCFIAGLAVDSSGVVYVSEHINNSVKAFARKFKRQLSLEVTCSICLGTYTDPKQLQCQHAYCQQCLKEQVQQDQQGQPILICPTCRLVTPVPASGVAGLQADFCANQLLETMGKEPTQIARSDLAPKSMEFTSPHCPDHDEALMEVYCETCKEAICWKCSLDKHREHNCETLDEVFVKCKEDLLSLSKAIVLALAMVDSCGDDISNQQAAIEEEYHCIITEDVKKNELISHLYQLTQTKLKGLAAQRDQLETVKANIDNFMSDAGIQEDSPLKKSNRIKQWQKLTTTFQPELLKPSTEADMIYLLPEIETSEICVKKSLDLSKYCIASTGTGIAIVGGTSTTSLQTQCPIKIDFISCELVSEITGTRVDGKVKRIRQSQYKISYQPTIKGRHQLHIKVEGHHIRGSPFPVAARSPVETLGTPILTISGMKGPQGVAVNQRGEVVVAEMKANCVSVFSPNGERLRSFGSYGSGHGQFQCPYGVAIDCEENILVTDKNNHRIQKFTSQGEFLASVGAKGTGPLEFAYPYGISFNASNSKVYVVDGSGRIQVLNSDLSYLDTLGKKGVSGGEFVHSRYIACDSTGSVFATDCRPYRIKVFTADREFLKVLAKRGESEREPEFFGIATDFSDRVYISDNKNHSILVYTYEGQLVTSFGSRGKSEGQFDFPTGLAVDDSGVVYVCDIANNRLQLF